MSGVEVPEGMKAWEQEVKREGFAPCPTCHQWSHSLGKDQIAEALRHFETMMAHPVRGHPMGHIFDEQTRNMAQILVAAARNATTSDPVLPHPEVDDMAKGEAQSVARRDADRFGIGFEVDGVRVHPSRVIMHKPRVLHLDDHLARVTMQFDTPDEARAFHDRVACGGLREALRNLVQMARTSGGTAGPDAALIAACEQAERLL